MVISLHPFVIDDDQGAIGYMADTLIVGAGGASPVSGVSRELSEV